MLANNINTSGFSELSEWKPIGEASPTYGIATSNFTGTLDGDGYTINTITYTNTTKNDVAFIHTIAATGTVKNLHINISATNLAVLTFGGVAVHNYGLIENVYITGYIHSLQNRTWSSIGGAVVYNYSGATVSHVVNSAIITADTNSTSNTVAVGGVVYNNSGTMAYVGNTGNITANVIGGVAYLNSSNINYAYNKGGFTVVAHLNYTQTIAVGGIIARNNAGGRLTYSYSLQNANINITNNASGTDAYVGGLIGMNGSSLTIINSYTVFVPGTFTGSAVLQVGAIAGSSSNYIGIFNRVYYQDIPQTLYDIGNVADVVGIEVRSQTAMQQATFVTLLENNFSYVTSNYPELTWEAAFDAQW